MEELVESADYDKGYVDSLVEGRPYAEDKHQDAQSVPEVNPYEKYKFTANGKEVIPKDDDYMKGLMSKGYDYSQKMNELNQRQNQYRQYEEFDQWAMQNPDKWKSMQNSTMSQQAPQQQEFPEDLVKDPRFTPLFEKMQSMEGELGYLKEIRQERELQRRTQEDTQLKTEMNDVRKEFPDMDFDSFDADGKTLEYRIMEHAQNTGIPTYKYASRDFLHDKIVARSELRGKEQALKGIQKNNKLGLLGETPAPLLKLQSLNQKMSYDDIAKKAMRDLGIS